MKINIKEVLIIISLSIFLGFIRYFLLDEEFSLIKKTKLGSIDNSINYNEVDSLLLYIKNTKSPKLIDVTLAKLFYDNNLVTFIDARDTESYIEEHILNALNIPYDLIEDVLNEYDIRYLIELNEDFIEEVYIEDNNPFYFGLKEGNIYLSNKKIDSPTFNIDGKEFAFVIYCSGEGCSLSEDLGFYMFNEIGVEKIFIYEGGIPEWKNNNYPIK